MSDVCREVPYPLVAAKSRYRQTIREQKKKPGLQKTGL